MSQTYCCNYYHIVYSTKHRQPLIAPDWQSRLWEYLGGIVNNHKGRPYQIGGVADHVHLLISLHQSVAISDFVRDLKAASSSWIHDVIGIPDLWWQGGYGSFTVSHSMTQTVAEYIHNQAEHHKTMTFEDELRRLLERHGVEFDERYFLSD